MLTDLKASYSGVRKVLRRYWGAYRGWSALLLSPYFHAAVLFDALLTRYWLSEPWWDVALTVLPNVLGFTLAGFTIWLGFGDEEFRRRLSRSPGPAGSSSAFMGVSAAFVHFVVVQIAALLAAVWAKAMSFALPAGHFARPAMEWLAPLGQAFGFLLFIYALMAALAATLGVFRAASWYDHHRRKEDGDDDS